MASRKRTYKTVQVCVSPERHAELKAIADGEGIALSKLAGDLIYEALQYRRKGRAKVRMTLSQTKSARFSRSIKPCRNRTENRS